MRFIDVHPEFPVSNSVVYAGHVFQTELTGVPPGQTTAVPGGAAAEMREICSQLNSTLTRLGVDKTSIVSCKLFLQDMQHDSAAVDAVYADYFGSHTPTRGVYGVELAPGILVEATFVANVPVYE